MNTEQTILCIRRDVDRIGRRAGSRPIAGKEVQIHGRRSLNATRIQVPNRPADFYQILQSRGKLTAIAVLAAVMVALIIGFTLLEKKTKKI